jgi:dTDP-4-dehydrorhamnose reductase
MIWLIGHKGMLGSKVLHYLEKSGLPSIQSDIEVDITSPPALSEFVENKKIDWVINCSAYTAVDKAEDEKDLAYQINAKGVLNIANVCKSINAKLIHISTDYVFDGNKTTPYVETDSTNPIGVYGASKLEGDLNLASTMDRYFIIRTSWLYGENGKNFVASMLKFFKERNQLNIVNDQHGCPTYTGDLAQFILRIVTGDSKEYGTYHFSNENETTWYLFTLKIFELAKKYKLVDDTVEILPITTDQFPTKAVRPKYTVFSKEKAKRIFDIEIRNWEQSLEEYISKLAS